MSTPTPCTDALYFQRGNWANEEELRDLARKLETELAEAKRLQDYNAGLACDAQIGAKISDDILAKLQDLHSCSREMVVFWCAHAAERSFGLTQCQADLAEERARLDWVFRNCKVFAADCTIHDREDLGAAMKEDAK
jgi:hypothetical protein